MTQCPVCEHSSLHVHTVARDIEYFTVDEEFTFLRCESCQSLRIDPVPIDRLSEIYPANYYSFSHGLDSPVYRVKQWLDTRLFGKVLQSLEGDSLAALDVGGGTGWQLDLLRHVDSRVRTTHVVDIDTAAASEALAAGHAYFNGRIEDFETDRRFDLVLMLNLIEHVNDPVAVLGRVRSLLTAQGVVLIKTPNVDSLDARLFRHRLWAGYHCPRHWVLFTRESIAIAARRAGLDVRSFRYTQGAPFWSGSILNALSTRSVIRVDRDHPMLTHWLSTPLLALFAAFDLARAPFSKTSQMFVVLGRTPSR